MNETVIPTMCSSHCGGACLLKAHVQGGIVTRIETDDGDEPQVRACLKGRAYRQVVYAPDRVLYPLKRVGERGASAFKRISWDEALDTVAHEIERVRDRYGPKSILYLSMAGDVVWLNVRTIARVLAMAGGYTTWWGTASFHGGVFASIFSYGTIYASSTRDNLLHSKLIIMWGWDPAVTVSGPNTCHYLAQAREQGTRILSVDPHCSDSAATFAEQWIPIRPGTDAAMLIAMAHVIIMEDLLDREFIARHTTGFDRYEDYVLGGDDGEPKSPAWAEAITGVPAAQIEELARAYATVRPAALMAGIAPGRTAFGEQYHRAAIALAAMTGNVGVPGGDAAARAWEGGTMGGYPYPIHSGSMGKKGEVLPFVPNPVESPSPYGHWRHDTYPRIHFARMADAILTGRAGGYPADYKMAFMDNVNYLNSMPNVNKTVRALKSLEFIATMEQFMNPTARYADIVLPTTTFMERTDIAPGVGMAYYGLQPKIIEPLGECKPQREIAQGLAERLGISGYDEESELGHVGRLASEADIPDFDDLSRNGIHRLPLTGPHPSTSRSRRHPARSRSTPSRLPPWATRDCRRSPSTSSLGRSPEARWPVSTRSSL
jgi:anaerobic dimethyl sulfoxide reductase subunit A